MASQTTANARQLQRLFVVSLAALALVALGGSGARALPTGLAALQPQG